MTITIDGTPRRMVPVEPDADMLLDGHTAAKTARTSGASGMTIDAQVRAQCAREAAAYAAMLAAAPPDADEAVVELVRATVAAAKTFRWYEQLHAVKGPEHQHKTERNRVEAEKLESALARFKVETDDDR